MCAMKTAQYSDPAALPRLQDRGRRSGRAGDVRRIFNESVFSAIRGTALIIGRFFYAEQHATTKTGIGY